MLIGIEHTRRSLRRLIWTGGLLLTVLLIVAAVSRKKELPVRATIVKVKPLADGALLIDSADVIRLVRKSTGATLDELRSDLIDEDSIERALEDDPLVRNAEVALLANSTVRISVEQRVPLVRIIDKSGVQYYLDTEGVRMPLSRHVTARTLVATGQIPGYTPDYLDREGRHPLQDLFRLTQFLVADPFWNAMIEQVHLNGKGEWLLVPKVGDQVVVFGRWDADAEEKFNRLLVFYQEAMSREGWWKYRSVDLRFRGQVVCQRR
ncbi:MAG: hypothetical protein RLY31_2767 [Bacteroidota bacterium]|jgi:cell division protein FtsQ